MTSNRLYFWPFWCPTSATLSSLVIGVTSGAAGSVRMGIYTTGYSAAAGLYPNTLLVDAGTASVVASGYKEIATTQQLNGDTLYWIAAVSDTSPTVRVVNNTEAVYTATRNNTGGAKAWFTYQGHTYGALPATTSGLTDLLASSTFPILWVET
jgi:hypothetical protein